jgi:hypothetical protein
MIRSLPRPSAPAAEDAMYYLGKALEMLGMTSLMVALFVGITDEEGMAKEYLFLGIGVVVFLVGRLCEKRGGRSPH